MEREANLPQQPRSASDGSNLARSSSSPQFLRHVQAAFKRHRTLGSMATNVPRARRILNSGREPSRRVSAESSVDGDSEVLQNVGSVLIDERNSVANLAVKMPEDSTSITPPSITETVTSIRNDNLGHFDLQGDGKKSDVGFRNVESQAMSTGSACLVCPSKRADEQMATDTITSKLSSHFSSLALTESEFSLSSQVAPSTVNNQDLKQRDFQMLNMSDVGTRSGGACLLEKRSAPVHDQHHVMAFLGKDAVHSMTQSLVTGSCATTMSVHSTSAPMPNSTTYNPHSRRDSSPHMEIETLGDVNTNPQPINQGELVLPSGPKFQSTSAATARPTTMPSQMMSVSVDTSLGVQDKSLPKGQGSVGKECDGVAVDERPTKKESVGDISGVQSQAPSTKSSTSDVYLDPSQSRKAEKAISGKGTAASRKKIYDPNVFFKVNGKLYQKLGKIGSGGSSEVHKVIASDCTIYALKKIKLKGRDYSTAYGFCQEIEYLNKLKGKNNIIELIDYEVTDRVLLEEVMSGSMTMKDHRIQDDGYIYMVLEYGEIDLAHMLSQKWKEMNSSSCNINENWLRFYWQQILQAVNTIHEERIVHSDLKPANFLLVKGSLKLIDFGIAKAILNDTTNIQRDAQVGTLNYMSPEAFMWNDHDANGNMIKCGRSSDIWSLGCILYQMVYGRTPFAEYKTFWAKFKVVTDCNHEITYDPVSNPWLLDLMRKCLAWERTERWRIPQLLQHPFLVPPIPHQFPSNFQDYCQLLLQMTKTYAHFPHVSRLCSQLMQTLSNLQTE